MKMTSGQARISWGIVTAALIAGVALNAADEKTKNRRSVEQLLPGNTVIFMGQDGSAAHKDSWEKTAAYEAMYKSGMVDVVEKVFAWIGEQSGAGQNPQVEKLMHASVGSPPFCHFSNSRLCFRRSTSKNPGTTTPTKNLLKFGSSHT